MGSACSAVKDSVDVKLNNHEESVARKSSHRRTKGSIFSSKPSEASSQQVSSSVHRSHSLSSSPSPGSSPSGQVKAVTPPAPPPAVRPCPSLDGLKIVGVGMGNLAADIQRAVWGRLDGPLPPCSKEITVYHCAQLTDSHVERDMLLESVYPGLRVLCAERSCELHLVDIHWGLQDESMDNHRPREVWMPCIKDICARDKNAIVTIFLNEKYGMYGCPTHILISHFNSILEKTSDSGKELLSKWYVMDNDRQPPSYKLQPISTNIANYDSKTEETHKKAWEEWMIVTSQICDILSGLVAEMDFIRPYLVSDLEEEIRSLFSGGISIENMIFIHRTFTQTDKDKCNLSDTKARNYFDVSKEQVNDAAQTKLKNLTNMLNSRLEPAHRMDFKVPWAGVGVDPKVKEHAKYLDQMCQSYKTVLTEVIERVLTIKEDCDHREIQVNGQGLPSLLFSELQHHTTLGFHLCQNLAGQPKLIPCFDHYVALGHPHQSSDIVRPLVLHGRTGSGRSSHAALFANNVCSVKGWERVVCVTRFVGASTECETLEQLLSSISQHICYVCNLPRAWAHQKPEKFAQLLKHVPHSHPLVVVIDGLDHIKTCGSLPVDWVPKELPKHIRVLLTTCSDCDILNSLRLHFANHEYIVAITPPESRDIPIMIDSIATRLSCRLPNDQRQQMNEQVLDPLSLVLAVYSTTIISNESSNIVEFLNSELEKQVNIIFDALETTYSVACVAKVLVYLSLARHGLSNSEMDDLLTCDEAVMQRMYPFNYPAVCRVPGYLWMAMSLGLIPMFCQRVCKGTPLWSWRHGIFGDVALKRYNAIINTAREALIDYFQGKKNGSKKTSPNGKTSNRLKHTKLVKPQPNMYKDKHNHRKLVELPFHIYQTKDKKATQKCLLNSEFLWGNLCGSGVYNVIQDLHWALEIDPGNQQYRYLCEVLEKSCGILVQTGLHFSSQLFLHAQSHRARNDLNHKSDTGMADIKLLHELTVKSPVPFLVPSRLEVATFEIKLPETLIHKIVRIPGDSAHMVTVAPDLGEVKVWNVHTQEVVRTLHGLDCPRDAKMIDGYRCVVLCNRELKIYNLDKGSLEAELKGVLNLKMPFYGIHIGGEHVVALSRNRMCINILNITNGDTVATFKVGEDRFLNSLLISKDGQICVCGDEVQKPFPLLVWDLQQRKLVHDLRIQGHEFITKMSAITSNGHYVVCGCKELEDPYPNFLIVYDLQSGALFKKWKPDCSTTGVAISASSGIVLSALEDGSLLVWDLITGSLKHHLRGPSKGPDVIRLTSDGTRCATYDSTCRDTSICLWDVIKGQCLGSIAFPLGVTCGEISNDGNLVMVGLPGMNDLLCLKPYSKKRNSQPDQSVYGDASRKGKVFDMAKSNT